MIISRDHRTAVFSFLGHLYPLCSIYLDWDITMCSSSGI